MEGKRDSFLFLALLSLWAERILLSPISRASAASSRYVFPSLTLTFLLPAATGRTDSTSESEDDADPGLPGKCSSPLFSSSSSRRGHARECDRLVMTEDAFASLCL